MLVLTRKIGEKVDIYNNGDFIGTVTLISIPSSNRARIGFEADQNILFIRQELNLRPEEPVSLPAAPKVPATPSQDVRQR